MDGWHEDVIWIRRDEKTREERHGIVNGAWAIHWTPEPAPGAHTLTHVPTGRRAGCFETREAAQLFADACDEVADWTNMDDAMWQDGKVSGASGVRDLCEIRAHLRGLERVEGIFWRIRETATIYTSPLASLDARLCRADSVQDSRMIQPAEELT